MGKSSIKFERPLKNTPFSPIFSLRKSYGSTIGVRLKRNWAFFTGPFTIACSFGQILPKINPAKIR
jgi:hypothetical protein